jgi:hypothetical protein
MNDKVNMHSGIAGLVNAVYRKESYGMGENHSTLRVFE